MKLSNNLCLYLIDTKIKMCYSIFTSKYKCKALLLGYLKYPKFRRNQSPVNEKSFAGLFCMEGDD